MDKLSILISSFNRPDLIGHSIESILASKIPEGLEIEIVIVDDQSNEETWGILNRYKNDPRFILFRNSEKKWAGGPNWSKGFELSTGNIIVNNEDDMIWHDDFISILYNELKKHDVNTCLFGMYIQTPSIEEMRPPQTRPLEPGPKIGFFTGLPKKQSIRSDEHISHNQLFCYKAFFNGMDEKWHHYPGSGLREETDLYLRALKMRPKRKFIAIPEAYLWHIHNVSGKNVQSVNTRRKRDSKNHIIFLKRNFGSRAPLMILFYRLYLLQKCIRDLIGHNLIDRFRK
jgi:glycosyltransferase involved in cell wall biosynthesis